MTDTSFIYKIVPGTPLLPLTDSPSTISVPTTFTLPSSALDKASGFMHMSGAAQVPGTLQRFFASPSGQHGSVYLLKVPYAGLEQPGVSVRWESPDATVCGPRHGEGLFPHIYLAEMPGNAGDGLPVLGGMDITGPCVVRVHSAVEVVSQQGEDGWDEALRRIDGWLV